MSSQKRRVEKLEDRNTDKNYKPPYVAIIKDDGTVTVSHADEDDFQLPSEEALQHWIDDNSLDDFRSFKVLIVKAQGKQPKEI